MPLVTLVGFIGPMAIPCLFWNEDIYHSIAMTLARYGFILHVTWLVNSAAHLWGHQPYDVHIGPRENPLVIIGAMGEGFHNYHHSFPWDYSTSEFGWKWNITTFFID